MEKFYFKKLDAALILLFILPMVVVNIMVEMSFGLLFEFHSVYICASFLLFRLLTGRKVFMSFYLSDEMQEYSKLIVFIFAATALGYCFVELLGFKPW